MKKNSFRPALTALLALLLFPISALAQNPGDGSHQHPRQAAIDACLNKAVGDSVEFINRRGDTVAATCTLVAIPDEPQRKGKMGDKQRGKMGDRRMNQDAFGAKLTQLLDLTPEQQAQVKQMRSAHRAENAPQREEIKAQRQQLHQAMIATPFDEAKLRAIIQQQSQARADLMVENARFREQLFTILTPAQQQKWELEHHRRMLNLPDDGPEGMDNQDFSR